MSKRKNRKQAPNLPPEMLERARQQLGKTESAEEAEEAVEAVEVAAPSVRVEAVKASAPRAASAKSTASSASSARARTNRRTLQPAQSRGERKSDSSDTNYVRNRLEHPTRFVSIEELKAEYSYVISDLRAMAILAVVLLVAMIVLEKLLA